MKEYQQNAQASILDRLIDNEPQASRESVQYRFNNVRQVKASIFRDLENLLNTKRNIIDPPDVCEEVNNSLFVYGLSDFTSHNPKSKYVIQHLRMDLEKTISLFEPRLKKASVHIDDTHQSNRGVRFRITAMIMVNPINEPVSFDTFLNEGEYVVSE
jgi:type VI secretion system protein ImpF